jgi:uncharacterized protein (TIGR02598 family)
VTRRNIQTASFSLVEITVALGIGAFCLIAILGLLPIGVQSNRDSSSQTAATTIMGNVIADMRATPNGSTTSTQYQVTFGTAKTMYFDGSGHFSTSVAPDSRYQLNIAFPNSGGGTFAPTYAALTLSWPAKASPNVANGSVEMFAAFDRH